MKKVLIFIALLCITGCDIKYDLSFKNEKIEEKIEVILPKKEKEAGSFLDIIQLQMKKRKNMMI